MTASLDGTARIWEVVSGRLLGTLPHGPAVGNVVFSPDGGRILTSSADGTARLWHAETNRILTILEGHHGDVLYAGFSPDGHGALTASFDGTGRLWRLPPQGQALVDLGRRLVKYTELTDEERRRFLVSSD